MNSDTFAGKLQLSAEGGPSRLECNSLLGGLNGVYTGVGRNLESGHRWGTVGEAGGLSCTFGLYSQ